MSWVIGIDLGGSKIAFGLINPANEIFARARIDTRPDEGLEMVIERIAAEIDYLKQDLPPGEEIASVGICTPGPVDPVSGDLHTLVNLPGISNTPFRRRLQARLGRPVKLDHDAKAAALGEFHYGGRRERDSMIFIAIGTGVGAGIIYQGKLFYGESYSAGEAGHMTVNPTGHPCRCGSRGCLETYASGPWLARHYAEAAGSHHQPNGAEVMRRAVAGDVAAIQVLQQAGHALGIAVASMAMMMNIERFVIGGSVAGAGELLLVAARESLRRYSFAEVSAKVKITVSGLGGDAPLLGCAWMARQLLQEG